MIFSAIFFPTHFVASIVLLSSNCMAHMSLSIPIESICCATFPPTPDIFINASNTFFVSKFKNQKRLWLLSVIW
jgi:hypothetical protein